MAVPRPDFEADPPRPTLTVSEALWGGVALLLIPVYVNTIVVWRWLEANLSAVALAAVPLLLVLGLATTLAVRHWPRVKVRPRHAAIWLSVAFLLAGIVWMLADPRFPAKRAHLFEYALLTLVVRQFFRDRFDEPMRTFAATVVASVLGLHDELLQGLHHSRFFAPMDVAVNALSAGVGGALAYAFHGSPAQHRTRDMKRGDWMVIAMSFVGLVGFVYCLAENGALRSNPLGLGLPLLAVAAWLLLSRGNSIRDGGTRLAAIVMGLSATTMAAPVIAIVFDLPFA